MKYAITCHWSVRVEYKHFFSDSEDVVAVEQDTGGPENKTFWIETAQDSAQFGVNFKF